jgi:putative membrane protein
MKILLNLLLRTLAILITTYIIPGVDVVDFLTAIVLVVVLGVLNAVLKPILVLLTLPVNVITLGLFTFVINGFLVFIASLLIPGFTISTFGAGVIFSIVLSLVNWFLNTLKR